MKRAPKPAMRAPRLFSEPDPPAGDYIANVDGASRGNPGPASYAVIVRSPDGATQFEIGKYLGRATNNVAEYYALITALDYALAHGITCLLVRSDSELLVRQMQGRYKVRSPELRPLFERAKKLSVQLAHFTIEHVRRELNAEADRLANVALDNTSSAPRSYTATQVKARMREQRVRARYSGGALHPLESLDLAEGQIVELTVKLS
jgi:probable phosphoglycerate mutase